MMMTLMTVLLSNAVTDVLSVNTVVRLYSSELHLHYDAKKDCSGRFSCDAVLKLRVAAFCTSRNGTDMMYF